MLVGGSPGCADGVNGDQLQLSPPLVMTEVQIDDAVHVESVRLRSACVFSGLSVCLAAEESGRSVGAYALVDGARCAREVNE